MMRLQALSVFRTVPIGGATKVELRARLEAAGVCLNEFARALFNDDRFVTLPAPAVVHTLELDVVGLGLAGGGTPETIRQRASALGLSPCPIELAAWLRLALLDQPESPVGDPPARDCAPPGSITVVSEALSDDDETPKGLYLRRVRGVLWLRGYRSSPGHVWSPTDRMVFAASGYTAGTGHPRRP